MIELLREIEATHGVPVELLCSALEEAMRDAFLEHIGQPGAMVVVSVDRESAAIDVRRRYRVVDDVPDPATDVTIGTAPEGYAVGDFLDEPANVGSFGRVAALTAKRVIAQRVLELDRERVYATYRPLQGTIVRGLVQREVHGSTYVVFDDGNEGVLPRSERAPQDRFRINDTVEAELLSVIKTRKGPALILSRSRASFVRAMFDLPEILAGARRPGKVTVLATSKPLPSAISWDVTRRLGDERVDIIRWSHDPAEMVVQLLPPNSGEAFTVPEHRLVIIESDRVTELQYDLACQLIPEWRLIVAEPGRSDVALEAFLIATAAIPPDPTTAIVDPELVRKLEEFARERAADEVDEE
jgi:N utilization substance protein A